MDIKSFTRLKFKLLVNILKKNINSFLTKSGYTILYLLDTDLYTVEIDLLNRPKVLIIVKLRVKMLHVILEIVCHNVDYKKKT